LSALSSLRSKFYECPKNRLAQNICVQKDPLEVAVCRPRLETVAHVYTHKVEEVKPICDQKSSGRCWNFAVHNTMRIPFMKSLNIEEFEFSQAYFFYWDKIERSYYFLNNIVESAKRGEDVNGRLVSFLLGDPIGDGGQWDMIVSIINKHGVMPKKCFPESFSCESSSRMNAILKSKLREYAKQIRDLFSSKASDADIQGLVDKQMSEIYNIVGICLGIPPPSFTWEYYDKNKKYNSVGPVTPLEFYEKHVKQFFNVDDKVCLVTDPRPSNEFGKGYTVDCLGNVVGGKPVFYNNQPVEVLMELVAESIKTGEPVWFGCEVSKRFARSHGIEDLGIVNYKLLFGIEVELGLSKADRLILGDSAMTHAMIITGVSLDKNDQVTKFRVENSWGEDKCGEKGFLVMTRKWFEEFGFEVVVDKKFVDDEILEVFNTEPTVLPAWDPMGNLAS
jgi:bleomycin hydrolase